MVDLDILRLVHADLAKEQDHGILCGRGRVRPEDGPTPEGAPHAAHLADLPRRRTHGPTLFCRDPLLADTTSKAAQLPRQRGIFCVVPRASLISEPRIASAAETQAMRAMAMNIRS